MASVAVLVPYQEMRELAEEMFGAYPQLVPFCVEYVQNEQVEERARELEKQGCDMIMARGLHAITIKRAVKLPVVEIRVTAQELGELILDIREELGKERPKIGLIGFENMLCDTSRFERLYTVELRRYLVSGTTDTENTLKSTVRKAIGDGCRAVLGGAVVCRTAADAGLCHRFIPGSRESLRAAFDLAKHIGYAIDQEKRNRAEIEAMLNASLDGIVRVNADGTVLWANASAYRLLNAPRETLAGHQISTVFPALNRDILGKSMSDETEAYTILRPSGKREIIVNTVPIRVGGHISGALLTLHEGLGVQPLADSVQRRFIIGDTGANHEVFHIFEGLRDFLAAGDFPDALNAIGIGQNHDIPRKIGGVRAGQVQLHAVMPRHGDDLHLLDNGDGQGMDKHTRFLLNLR